MVAKISSNTSLFGTLLYNKNKIDKAEASLLSSKNVYEKADGLFSMQTTLKSFEPYLAANKRTERPIFHVSINPSPKDNLSDESYREIADRYMEDMGYGNQPYVVFKHTDISRTHLHIVSVRVDKTGKKLDSNFENMRSMKICRKIEKEYALHPATKQEEQGYAIPMKPLNYKEGDVKRQVGNIAKAMLRNFSFQSMGEYRTLLEKMNVTVEEIKGTKNGKPYHGLVYSVLTDDSKTMKKEKIGTPFKSSLFGKSINLKTIEQHFQKSKHQIEKTRTRESLRPTIAKAIQQSQSLDEFTLLLNEQNIEPVFRKTEEGRIYGVTFIDYNNRCVLNGSRIGKEFSANVFEEKFKNQIQAEITFEQNPKQTQKPHSSFNTADELKFLGISLFEQHGDDYEEESFVKEKEQEEKLRQYKKRKGRGI